ncbi:MAG: hypothetical protein ABIH39_06900 [Candidatus Margulisiibacteriota bacterium]
MLFISDNTMPKIGFSDANDEQFNLYVSAANNDFRIADFVNGDLVTVKSSGNVGIGTTNPALGQLQIRAKTADSNHGITWYQNEDVNSTTARAYLMSDGAANYNFHITRGGVDNKGIVIDKDGNVGIGTTAPNAKLDVSGTLNSSEHYFNGNRTTFITSDTSSPAIYGAASEFEGESAIFGALILQSRPNSARPIIFATGDDGVERMRIAGDGNVGIGTTNPSAKLEVIGSVSANAFVTQGTPADYVFEPGYNLKTIEEQAAYMWAKKHLPALMGTEELGGKINIAERLEQAVEELEKAHVYIEQLNQSDKEKASEIQELLKRIEALENK